MLKSKKVWKYYNSMFSRINIARFLKLRSFGLFKEEGTCPNISVLILLEFQDLVS